MVEWNEKVEERGEEESESNNKSKRSEKKKWNGEGVGMRRGEER